MELKPRQQQAFDAVFAALDRGVDRQLVALPTGVGKTVLGAHIAKRFNRVLFLAHRQELIEQTARTMALVDPDRTQGRIEQGTHDLEGQFTIAMLPTVHRRLQKIPPDSFDCVIVDECFPAGTLVDGRPIEQLVIGDTVTAFNEATWTLRQAKITRLFKNPAPTALLRLWLNGRSLVCTSNHPLLTESGWKPACLVVPGENLFEVNYVNENPLSSVWDAKIEQQQSQFLSCLPERTQPDRESDHHPLQLVQDANRRHYEISANQGTTGRKDLLLGDLFDRSSSSSVQLKHDQNQSTEERVYFGKNEGQQSDDEFGCSRQDVGNLKDDWTSTQGQGWERQGFNCSTAGIVGSVELENRGCNSYQDSKRERIPDLLQGGYCRSNKQDCYRGRRQFSLCDCSEESGSEERRIIKPVRVEGIEIFKQGSDAEFTRLCPDGFVYNFTVEPFNTYVANGFIVHNCHHSCSRTWRETLDHFQPRLRLGLTATPERLDGLALSNLFTEISYTMSLADAVNEAYLVPPSAIQCLTSVNISAVHTRGGDLAEDELAALVDDPARNEFIAQKYLEHCPGRRGIAFAVNIAHAVHLTEAFRAVGVSAEWISGNDPLRSEKLERFSNGEFQVLANCQILTEGFDDCGVDAILLCRPTKSRSLYCQMLGRGLRLNPGKENCRVLDFVDVAGKHSLMSAWKFFGHTAPPANEMPLGIGDEPRKKESRVAAIDLERPINLFLPPVIPDSFAYGSAPWHREPATAKQLGFLEAQGYDIADNDFTRGQASALISAMPASTGQLRWLQQLNFDVSVDWTRQQATIALDDVKTRMSDALAKIRAKGFTVVAGNRRVIVEPPDRLDLLQKDWIERNKKPLLFALKAELKEAA